MADLTRMTHFLNLLPTGIRAPLQHLFNSGAALKVDIEGSVEGNVTGNVTGAVTGNVTGNVTGEHTHTSQTLTESGAVTLSSGLLMLSHATVAIAATKVAPAIGDELYIIDTSASGTAAHTVTLPDGVTWNGTNRIATLNAPGEALHVIAISATRFFVLENIGSVAFSNPA